VAAAVAAAAAASCAGPLALPLHCPVLVCVALSSHGHACTCDSSVASLRLQFPELASQKSWYIITRPRITKSQKNIIKIFATVRTSSPPNDLLFIHDLDIYFIVSQAETVLHGRLPFQGMRSITIVSAMPFGPPTFF
jgi:hypothetical protein